MMSAWGLLAFLKATDTRENASFATSMGKRRKLMGEARRRAEQAPSFDREPEQEADDEED